jgi:D-inositol-3-phosphate glycosyltransferase
MLWALLCRDSQRSLTAEYSGSMAVSRQRIAMVSMHSSPAAQPGTGDSGGMNVAILGIAAELAIRGVEVELLTRATAAPATTSLLPGVLLRELEAGPTGPMPKAGLAAVVDEFGEAVARLARTGRYDLMHAHYWLSGIAVLPVALELGLPLVQSFHTLAAMKDRLAAPGTPPEPEQRRRSEMYLAAQANAIIVGSTAEASEVIDLVGAPADRTWVIPPGVDLALFAPRDAATRRAIRERLRLPPERSLVVIAGRVQPLKGHELAIAAIAELRSRRRTPPLLVIVGEVTPGEHDFAAALLALARESGVAEDVTFVGALDRESLADLLASATVTIVPSFSETFGLVALESAAAGTPVIAFRVGGLLDAVEDRVSGLLLSTRAPADWADAIGLMLDDEELRASMGHAARAHAGRFTWGATATSLMGVYSSLGVPGRP